MIVNFTSPIIQTYSFLFTKKDDFHEVIRRKLSSDSYTIWLPIIISTSFVFIFILCAWIFIIWTCCCQKKTLHKKINIQKKNMSKKFKIVSPQKKNKKGVSRVQYFMQ